MKRGGAQTLLHITVCVTAEYLLRLVSALCRSYFNKTLNMGGDCLVWPETGQVDHIVNSISIRSANLLIESSA